MSERMKEQERVVVMKDAVKRALELLLRECQTWSTAREVLAFAKRHGLDVKDDGAER